MDARTGAFYAQHASRLARDYQGAGSDYFATLDRAFEKSRKILDVGCGTGRDCVHLLRRGKDIYGVDASPEMLAEAHALFRKEGLPADGRLFEGALPNLSLFADGEFDGVLCSAVLMHLQEESIFDAVYSLRRILRPGGSLLVSIPASRPGIDPETCRDSDGRLFTRLPPARLRLLFERVGFSVENTEEAPDSLGRPGLTWNVTVFTRLDETADRPLSLVESILNRDKKVATYKLALFRALAEIAQTQHHLATFTNDDKVLIPVSAVAEKWIVYYWPIFASKTLIRQGTSKSGSDVAIRPPLKALIEKYAQAGGLSAFYVDWKSARFSTEVRQLFQKVLAKFKETIWKMPVRHAGGGEYDVFGYDRNAKAIVMPAPLWRELCLTGYWIHDATLLRWAELTEQINDGIRASQVIDCLLQVPDAERNVADARNYFLSLPERACVWTDRSLDQEFAVDHAMPFSLWRNNDLWNLFPVAPKINAKKSDRLPTYDLLHRRRDRIIDTWHGLDDALGERFEREAQTLLGRDRFDRGNWEDRLFTRFVEAFEITAAQRGAPRWDPSTAALARTQSRPPRPKPAPPPDPVREEQDLVGEAPDKEAAARILPFHEVGSGAFKTHLPLVASLAAGLPFHGFETSDLTAAEDLGWIPVPPQLARPRRFVVRVAGDSMSPTLNIGDLVVFEYHRTPRRDREIVIANVPEFGTATDGTEAIKRITQDAVHWIFESDNNVYDPIRVPKNEIAHPILGTMVEKIE